MAQVIGNSFASRLGSSFGTGLGSGLQQLAQERLAANAQKRSQQLEMQKRMNDQLQYAQALSALGVPQQQALALSGLPEKERAALYQRGGLEQQPQQSSLQQALGGLSPEAIGGVQQGIEKVSPGKQLPTAKPQAGGFLEAMSRLSPAEAAQERRHQEKLAQSEQLAINKETLPFVTEVNKAVKAADFSEPRLARMEKLNNEGKLGSNLYNSLISSVSKQALGLDLTNLMTADAQEFEKLSTDFFKNIKDIVGTRVTNFDIQQFLKTVPTLNQSKEGRQRVITNLRVFNDMARVKQKSMRDIIKENKGKRPSDLEELVDERSKDELDKIAERFKSGPISNSSQYKIGQKLNALPDPSSMPVGAELFDSAVNKKLVNTGTEWV